jgi:teichuronic acid exporter
MRDLFTAPPVQLVNRPARREVEPQGTLTRGRESDSGGQPGASKGLLRSTAWNYAGYAFERAVSLALLAYVMRRVGASDYGLLLLALSVSALLALLDLGLPSLLVQAFAEERERGEYEGLARLLSTAFLVLGGLGALGVVVCSGLALLLPGPFRISADLLPKARTIFGVTGVSLAFLLPSLALEMLYEAFQRFDIINKVQMLTTMVRAVATLGFLAAGFGVLGLAWTVVLAAAIKLLTLWALSRSSVGVSPRLGDWDSRSLRLVWHPAKWALWHNITAQLSSSAGYFLLGAFAPVSAIAIYGIGSRIPAQLLLLISTGVLGAFPILTKYHAAGDRQSLGRVYTNTSRLAMAGVLPVVAALALLARPLIRGWVGSPYEGAAPVLVWLLMGVVIVALHVPSDHVLYATGRVRRIAMISTFQALGSIGLSLFLIRRHGAVGVAAAAAIAQVMGTAVWVVPSACRAAGVSARSFARRLAIDVAIPALAMAVPLTIGFLGPFGLARVAFAVAAVLAYVIVWVPLTGASLVREWSSEGRTSGGPSPEGALALRPFTTV